ncbi:MAG TPA: hypothetical protein VFQ81_08925 [Candidatus Limnocylindria bacterium]|nr:hypothetical protein [Candidatus Limnocylindria bacterium]
MTTQKLFKRRVRERMSKTGEGYSAARRQVAARRDRLANAPEDLTPALDLASDAKLTEATGHGWEHWLSTLDRWDGRDHTHGEIAAHLRDEHGVPAWWTQTVTNGYERMRGMRAKHQQADGFTIYASKTVGVPLDVLFEAFVDDGQRSQWLIDGRMSLRTAQPGRTARFDWEDGATRILVTFEEKAPAKSSAHVSHERLPDAKAAEAAKALWKKRVTALKAHLEADR